MFVVGQVKEITDIRVLYDKEVEDLKTAIAEMSANYSKLQVQYCVICHVNCDVFRRVDPSTS